ncbi:MAG: hypothetical protein IJZ53_11865 [Tyzzerella sp.]|nr:hypothetical protein [Tyzzerella sp.]
MSNELKTQWHPAFCSAMKLELKADREFLDYINEYNLSSKPLQIDLLVVKKMKEIEIHNEIGKIFRKHNILEYKSPDDSMNVNTFLKVRAYAYLYKTQEEHIDDILLDEITITLVRKRKPVKLFKWFRDNGYHIEEKYKGIYFIDKEGNFLTQVIVSSQLNKENQKWLTLLHDDLNREDAERVVLQVDSLTEESEKEHADSVLQVALQENRKLFNELKEEGKMCEALRKLMEPELNEAKQQAMQEGRQEGIQQGIQQGIQDTIVKSLKAGNSAEDISRIMQIPLEEVESIKNEKNMEVIPL